MGLAAATAVSAVAQGRMAPQLRQSRRGKKGSESNFSVRWLPGLIDSDHLAQLVASVPGAAMVGQQRQEALAFTTAVMGDVTNQVVKMAASQVEVPAPPPEVRDRNDISEAFLGRLDGSTFQAPDAAGAEIARRIDRWSAPVVGTKNPQLVVQLSPPDDSNAWHARVLGTSRRDRSNRSRSSSPKRQRIDPDSSNIRPPDSNVSSLHFFALADVAGARSF